MLISIDTLRADHVGCYGGARAHTPALDALAASGIRFETAISPAPLTLPAHASLMTGLDPPEHGVRHNSVFRLGDQVPTLAEAFRAGGFATGAFVGAFVLDRQFGLARGFDHYDDQMAPRGPESGAVGYAERPAAEVVDAALKWLENAPPRFFLWIHFYDPHARYLAPPGFAASFASSPYDGEIAYADSQVSRLLKAIGARHPDSKTLVAVTSDHGESLGEHGEATHSHTIYDATQRIPMILSGPGVPVGATLGGVVSLKDLGPTLLDLAGVAPLAGATGRSLGPVMNGEDATFPAAYSETLATQLDMNWSPLLALRTETYRYIRAPRPELFQLATDPGERDNLAAAEPEAVRKLDAELSRRLERGGAAAPSLRVTSEERERLEGLGYIVPDLSATERPLGVVGGPDPKDHISEMVHVHRAGRLVGEQKWAEAIEALREAEDPGTTGLILMATAALALGDNALAESAARDVIARKPLHATGFIRLANALEAQLRLDEAEATWKRVQQLDPAAPETWIGLGRISEFRGDRKTAASYYRKAMDARVPNRESTWRLAALEIEQGNFESANALLRTLPDATRADLYPAIRLAQADRLVGRFAEARAHLEAVPTPQRASSTFHLVYADVLEQQGEFAAARVQREAALAEAPDDPRAQNDLAWSLADLGEDLGRAETLVRSALARVGRVASLLDTLATVELRQGRPKDARATVAEARKQATGELVAHLDLIDALALYELGDFDAARERLDAARAARANLPRAAEDEAGALAAQLGADWPPRAGD